MLADMTKINAIK